MILARHSALYTGSVRHRRHDAVGHRFTQPVQMLYLDLDELPALCGDGLRGRGALPWWLPWRYRRADFFGPRERPLGAAVRDAFEPQLGVRPARVRMLAMLRSFGIAFNPVVVYYGFDAGERLLGVLAEITNTPWRERHHYVLPAGLRGARGSFAKQFHVSPFQPMAQDYAWWLRPPGAHLAVHMENRSAGDGAKVFDATLSLRRQPLTRAVLWRALWRQPCPPGRALLGIYWHALRLFWRRAPFFVHPKKRLAT